MTLARLARWCYQQRWRVLIAWIILLVAMNVVSGAVGSAYDNSFSGGNSDSAAALSLLQNRFPQAAPANVEAQQGAGSGSGGLYPNPGEAATGTIQKGYKGSAYSSGPAGATQPRMLSRELRTADEAVA